MNRRLDGAGTRSFQVRQRQVPAADRPREHAAGEVPIDRLALPGAHQVANPAHALRVPHHLAQFAQLAAIEIGRVHQVHRGKAHHLHVVRQIHVVLLHVEQFRMAIHQVRVRHGVENLLVVVLEQIFVIVVVRRAFQAIFEGRPQVAGKAGIVPLAARKRGKPARSPAADDFRQLVEKTLLAALIGDVVEHDAVHHGQQLRFAQLLAQRGRNARQGRQIESVQTPPPQIYVTRTHLFVPAHPVVDERTELLRKDLAMFLLGPHTRRHGPVPSLIDAPHNRRNRQISVLIVRATAINRFGQPATTLDDLGGTSLVHGLGRFGRHARPRRHDRYVAHDPQRKQFVEQPTAEPPMLATVVEHHHAQGSARDPSQRLRVQRRGKPRVQYPRCDAAFGQSLGGQRRGLDHRAPGHDRHVLAFTQLLGRAAAHLRARRPTPSRH